MLFHLRRQVPRDEFMTESELIKAYGHRSRRRRNKIMCSCCVPPLMVVGAAKQVFDDVFGGEWETTQALVALALVVVVPARDAHDHVQASSLPV